MITTTSTGEEEMAPGEGQALVVIGRKKIQEIVCEWFTQTTGIVWVCSQTQIKTVRDSKGEITGNDACVRIVIPMPSVGASVVPEADLDLAAVPEVTPLERAMGRDLEIEELRRQVEVLAEGYQKIRHNPATYCCSSRDLAISVLANADIPRK